MTNYIKLKDCLTLIPRHAFREANISDFLAWMFEVLRHTYRRLIQYPEHYVYAR